MTIAVDLHQWVVVLDRQSVPAGVPVRLVATNTGSITHSLFVAGPNRQTAALASGEKASLDVVFSQTGTLSLYCWLGGGSHRQVGMDAPLTVTEPDVGVNPAPVLLVLPTPTQAPMSALDAAIDHVGLPVGYREQFTPFFENDRVANRDVHVAYINAVGARAREDRPFPYGTVIVLEWYPAQLTADAQIARDSKGRFLRQDMSMVFVMRKERGLGAKYGVDRTGEWEYADYKPDGTFHTVPELTQSCAQCHLALSNARQVWLIRADRFFTLRRLSGGGEGAVAEENVSLGNLIWGLMPLGLAITAPVVGLIVFPARSFGRRG